MLSAYKLSAYTAFDSFMYSDKQAVDMSAKQENHTDKKIHQTLQTYAGLSYGTEFTQRACTPLVLATFMLFVLAYQKVSGATERPPHAESRSHRT